MAGVSTAIITSVVFQLFDEVGKKEPASVTSLGDVFVLIIGAIVFAICVIQIYNWWTDK